MPLTLQQSSRRGQQSPSPSRSFLRGAMLRPDSFSDRAALLYFADRHPANNPQDFLVSPVEIRYCLAGIYRPVKCTRT